MDQINALFKPPGDDPAVSKTPTETSELHPYFKRPGRGHNHDNCDSCGEGGDLICCDSCPSSFHFQCHDPPLEDKDIPEGDWICIKCFSEKAENMKLVAVAKKQQKQRAITAEALKQKTPVKMVKSPAKSKPKVLSGEEEESEVETDYGGKKLDMDWKPAGKGKAKKVVEEVVVETARSSTRPSRGLKQKYDEQFNIEEEIEESIVLEEEKIEKVLRLSKPKPKMYRELYIDHLALREEKTNSTFDALLSVVRATSAEEFQLPSKMGIAEKFPYSWKWSEPKKVKARADEDLFEPRGQVKFCYVCVKSSRLGPLIQCDYCPSVFHMDCLDPPLSEKPRDVWMCPNHVENFLDSKLLNSTSITKRLELWDKYAKRPIDQNSVKINFLNRVHRKVPPYKRKVLARSRRLVSVPKFIKDIYANPRPLIPGPGYEHWMDPAQRGITVKTMKAAHSSNANHLNDAKDDIEESKDGDGRDDEMEWVAGLVSLQTDILKQKMEGDNELVNDITIKADEHDDNDITMKTINIEDTDIAIKTEDFQKDSSEERDRLKLHIDIKSPGESTISGRSLSPRFTDPDNFSGMTAQLHEYLMSRGKDPSLLNPTILQYLATKQIESMFSSDLSSSSRMSEVASRASLAPIGSRKTPAHMKYRSLHVGTGGQCSMNLTSYGHCNYVSFHHAKIYHDKLSGGYELINYSEFGTMVDNCLYTNDTLSLTARDDIAIEAAKNKNNENSENERTMAGPGWSSRSCHCTGPASTISAPLAPSSGCEASALLHTGSQVRFGCLRFVFTIAGNNPHFRGCSN